MAKITTKDGTEIFYKDWGSGQPIVFHHGWPLSSDDWDAQLLFFLSNGYRVVAHDRRGHGRSTQTWRGNDMDTYADDVAQLAGALDLRDAVHVGHSTGGGEVAGVCGAARQGSCSEGGPDSARYRRSWSSRPPIRVACRWKYRRLPNSVIGQPGPVSYPFEIP